MAGAAALVLLSGHAGAATGSQVVNVATGQEYPSMAQALAAAGPGDHLRVAGGNIGDLRVAVPGLRLESTADAVLDDVTIDAPNVVLRGFTIGGDLTAGKGLSADARANSWGTDSWREAVDRAHGDALVLPLVLADGSLDPPAPVVAPGSHCAAAALTPLSLQEALYCAHPGGFILLQPSGSLDPPPQNNYFEPVVIDFNCVVVDNGVGNPLCFADDVALDGLTICSDDGSGCGLSALGTVIDGAVDPPGPAITYDADDVTVQALTIRGSDPLVVADDDAAPNLSWNDLEQDLNALADTDGVYFQGADGARIFQNQIRGNLVPGSVAINVEDSDDVKVVLNFISGAGTNIRVGDTAAHPGTTTSAEIRGNVIRTSPENQGSLGTLGISLFAGSDHDVLFNTLQGVSVGLLVGSSSGASSLANTFEDVDTCIRLKASTGVQPTGFASRRSTLGCAVGVHLDDDAGSDVSGNAVDVRNNKWLTDSWRVIQNRIVDDDRDNTVLFTPFLLVDGSQDPPPLTVIGANHCSSVPIAPVPLPPHPLTAAFQPLSLEEALRCSHPGSTILVPPSLFLGDPTPYLENVIIEKNRGIVSVDTLTGAATWAAPSPADEVLAGLTLCGSTDGAACAFSPGPASGPVVETPFPGRRVVDIRADDVTVQGLVLRGSIVAGAAVNGFDGSTIESNAIEVPPSNSGQRYGVWVRDADGATVRGNTIQNNGLPNTKGIFVELSDGAAIALNNIRASHVAIEVLGSSGASVRGNVITEGPVKGVDATKGVLLLLGDGHHSQFNTYRGVDTGLTIVGATNTIVTGENFQGVPVGVHLRSGGAGPQQPTGTVLRFNHFAGSIVGLSLEGSPQGVNGVLVDARLNRWGSDSWRVADSKIDDQGAGNNVVFTPFKRASDDAQDPPQITVLGGTHCSSSGIVPLSVQEALLCAHPGSTVLVRPSLNGVDPTPYFESLVVSANGFGSSEVMDGLTVCSAPVGVNDCSQPQASRSIIDGSATGSPVVDVEVDGLALKGLTVQYLGPLGGGIVRGIDLGDSAGTAIENGVVRMSGGGCADTCYATQVRGIDAVEGAPGAADTVIRDSRVMGDFVGSDATIGSTDGVRGRLPGGLIADNTVTGWANHGVFVWGAGLDVRENLFTGSNTGLKVCTGGWSPPVDVTRNTFAFHFDAIDLTGCGTGTGVVINNNVLTLTNQVALRLLPSTTGLSVDAECNDWGVHHAAGIPLRIADEGLANAVDFIPFTAPRTNPSPSLACLVPPLAAFSATPNPTDRLTDVAFDSMSVPGSHPIVTHFWDFGDGDTELIPGPDGDTTHAFTTTNGPSPPWSFLVTYTTTDANGETSSSSQIVIVENLAPVLDPIGARSVVHNHANPLTYLDVDGAVGSHASLALGSPPRVAYYDAANQDLKFLACGDDACSAGNSVAVVDALGDVGQFASLAFDGDGAAWIAYYDATSGDLKLAHCGNDGCDADNDLVIMETGEGGADVGRHASLAIVPDPALLGILFGGPGVPAVAHYDATTGDLLYTVCGEDGCDHENATTGVVDDGAGNDVGRFASVALDGDGVPSFAYYDATNGDLLFALCAEAACSSPATKAVVDSAGDVGLYASLALGGDGLPVIAYYDATNGDLKVAHCDDAACATATLAVLDATADVGQHASLATASPPRIAYYDATNGDLKIALCLDPACAASSALTLDDDFDVGRFASLALDDGVPVVAYLDDTYDNLRLLRCALEDCAHASSLSFPLRGEDPDGDNCDISAAGLPPGATLTAGPDESGTPSVCNATFSWTGLDFDDVGSYLTTFTVTDTFTPDAEIVPITVVDNLAAFTPPIGAQATKEDVALNLDIVAADPDGDPVALSTSALPAGATFVDLGDGRGRFEWLPVVGQAGVYNVHFTATSHGVPSTEPVTITVGVKNVPCLPSVPPVVQATAATTFSLTASAIDLDGPDLVSWTHSTAPNVPFDSFVDHGDGTATYTWLVPPGQFTGTDLTVQCFDGIDVGSATVAVEVLRRPDALFLPPLVPGFGPVDSPLAGEGVKLQARSADPGGAITAATFEVIPPPPALPLALPGALVGPSLYEADYAFPDPGTYLLRFTATDNSLPLPLDRVVTRVVVVVANMPPVADAGFDRRMERMTVEPVTLDGSRSSDERPTLTYEWTQLSGPAVGGLPSSNVAFTFLPGEIGLYLFQLEVTDGLGLMDTDTVRVLVDDGILATAQFVGTDPNNVGMFERPVVAVRVLDDLGAPVANANVVAQVVYRTGNNLPASTSGTTNADGFVLLTLPYDTGLTVLGANVPGLHTVTVTASAPSRAGAPDPDTERSSDTLLYTVSAP